MALELRLVLDGEFTKEDSSDPAVLVKALHHGRILGVALIPEACPQCDYTPYCCDWCSLKTYPNKSEK